ncbi:MAG: hypothetical protein EZS28_032219 [Streblomastix strix]|uniref:Uncharacterized protein n=1 Tax=Streblomastix strix TaxID=222440 RepID=A0A5J4UQA7_9EUKA|nr:MAG: hypothetical protein EZS28_032219 [Streblomastix strix]
MLEPNGLNDMPIQCSYDIYFKYNRGFQPNGLVSDPKTQYKFQVFYGKEYAFTRGVPEVNDIYYIALFVIFGEKSDKLNKILFLLKGDEIYLNESLTLKIVDVYRLVINPGEQEYCYKVMLTSFYTFLDLFASNEFNIYPTYQIYQQGEIIFNGIAIEGEAGERICYQEIFYVFDQELESEENKSFPFFFRSGGVIFFLYRSKIEEMFISPGGINEGTDCIYVSIIS